MQFKNLWDIQIEWLPICIRRLMIEGVIMFILLPEDSGPKYLEFVSV